MMGKQLYLAQFMPDSYYHVYNRTNNRELLFLDDADRRHFLRQYRRYVADYVHTYAYCLLPNHFHIAICIKPFPEVLNCFKDIPRFELTVPQRNILAKQHWSDDFHALIERQFSRMFTAYSMYFNNKYRRSGNLFYRQFKRRCISDMDVYRWVIYYIHSNPMKHQVMHDFTKYPWSSYQSLLSVLPTLLCRDMVWTLFGSIQQFVAFHQSKPDWPLQNQLDLEED